MGNPLLSKLRVLPGQRRLLLNAPSDQSASLEPWPDVAPDTRLSGSYAWVLLYAASQAELDQYAPQVLAAAEPSAVVWIAYPKLTGRIRSDLTRDKGWAVVDSADWLGVTQISLGETWSALRFRPRADIPTLTRKADRPGTAKKAPKKALTKTPAKAAKDKPAGTAAAKKSGKR